MSLHCAKPGVDELNGFAIRSPLYCSPAKHACRRVHEFTLMQVVDMPGHNTSLFVLGVMILWFGWYGFNPGSQLALVNNSQPVANAAVTTTLAPGTAGLSALFAKSILGRQKAGG